MTRRARAPAVSRSTPAFRVTGCGRASPTITALTWLPDDMFSDVVTPLPAQPDPGIAARLCGRLRLRLGDPHQARDFMGRRARYLSTAPPSRTPSPIESWWVLPSPRPPRPVTASSTHQPTDFIINLSDPVDPTTVQPTDFTVNGTPANADSIKQRQCNDHLPLQQLAGDDTGPADDAYPGGAFNRAIRRPCRISISTCTFCYAVTPLQVTTTNPPVGGTFSPPAPGDYNTL